MATIRVERALAETPEIRELIGALNTELAAHYTPEQQHGISLNALFQPPVRFFMAHTEAGAQGCGGIALFDDFAELKRMYVREEARGVGVADALIARLIEEAAQAGLTLLRLETGIAQARAMRFYRRHGFETCAAFEPYAAMAPSALATSVFMEKQI